MDVSAARVLLSGLAIDTTTSAAVGVGTGVPAELDGASNRDGSPKPSCQEPPPGIKIAVPNDSDVEWEMDDSDGDGTPFFEFSLHDLYAPTPVVFDPSPIPSASPQH